MRKKTLKRGEIHVEPKHLVCRYCSVFHKQSLRDKKRGRYCRPTRKWKKAEDKGCKHFRPNKNFWCDAYGFWLTLAQCENRRIPGTVWDKFKNLKCRSKECGGQFRMIDRIIRFAEENDFATAPKVRKKLERNTNRPSKKLTGPRTLKRLERKKSKSLKRLRRTS